MAARCEVMGNGRVVILRGDQRREYNSGDTFHPEALGEWRVPQDGAGIRPAVWQEAVAVHEAMLAEEASTPTPDDAVQTLVAQRTAARAAREWAKADELRDAIAALGWQVNDTPNGPELEPLQG